METIAEADEGRGVVNRRQRQEIIPLLGKPLVIMSNLAACWEGHRLWPSINFQPKISLSAAGESRRLLTASATNRCKPG